uniref:Uncharacterized protein n=1 Tax=Electrophorus electricus TaxID=8005 RepID=A0A4W4GZ18_ELEEL
KLKALIELTFWMVPLRLRSIISTLCAISCVCLCRSSSTDGSMGGMSAGRRSDPRLRTTGPELGRELILIFCSRFLVMKCVRSPSRLTVPSSSRALDMVALRPSACPPLVPKPLDPPPHPPPNRMHLESRKCQRH